MYGLVVECSTNAVRAVECSTNAVRVVECSINAVRVVDPSIQRAHLIFAELFSNAIHWDTIRNLLSQF